MRSTLLCIFLFLSLGIIRMKASHLRAADIVLERVSGTTYNIIITLFSDGASSVEVSKEFLYEEMSINGASFEDLGIENTPTITDITIEGNAEDVIGTRFTYQYTFQVGLEYIISYQGFARNGDIENINEGASASSYLYVDTKIDVPANNPGNTPRFINDPLFFAQTGQIFTYNPGAYDPDGDSLAFDLVTPRGLNGEEISGYEFLDGLTIDEITGTIVWDLPLEVGEYNIAYRAKEYRNGILNGYVTRDVQLIVSDGNNEPPLLVVPNDTCVVAGETLSAFIYARDTVLNANQSLTISTNGTDAALNASITLEAGSRVDSVSYLFEWTPTCAMAQEQPTILTFRAYDNPTDATEISLSTYDTWLVSVKAQAPTGLIAARDAANEGIDLSWDDYSLVCGDAEDIIIWRIDCQVPVLPTDACSLSSPESLGFEQIATTSASNTSYYDATAEKGITYYYAITSEFGSPSFATSVLSDTSSASLELDIPTLTKVDVLLTDDTNGEIFIEWVSPKSTTITEDYTYTVFRMATVDFTEDVFTEGTPIVTNLDDSSFTDQLLNTLDSAYLYGVQLVTNTSGTTFNSTPASSTFLQTSGINEGISLSWSNHVPWGSAIDLYNTIYEGFTFVAAQDVGYDSIFSVISTDEDFSTATDLLAFRQPCDTFYYYVETQGEFCSDVFQDTVTNRSQISFAIADDTIAPESVVLTNTSTDTICTENSVSFPLANSFTWIEPNTPGQFQDPRSDITFYLVYAKGIDEDEFSIKDTIFANESFEYSELFDTEDRASIYAVSAVDEKENESALTELSVDNCSQYELPNIFTPNDDGINDTFVPMDGRRFVSSFELKIYNRWGALVFETDDVNINWDASNVTDGTFFYEYSIVYDGLEEESEQKKGFITVKR